MTYWDIKKVVKGNKAPLLYANESLENVIIEEGKDDEGHFYKLTSCQGNGWCRVNYYYETGVITETYER